MATMLAPPNEDERAGKLNRTQAHINAHLGSPLEQIQQDRYTPVDLREYIGIVRSRKWTVILVALLVLGLALAYSYRQEPLYQSRSRLLLKAIPATGYFPSSSLETESQLVGSDPVAEQAAEVMEEEDASGLLGGLSVSGFPESQVLEISYSSGDPEFAAEAANAFAEGFLLYQLREVNNATELQKQELQTQIDDVQIDLRGLRRKINGTEPADTRSLERLRGRETALAAQLTVLQQQLASIRPAVSGPDAAGTIIEEATPASSPYSPNHPVNAVMGLLLGLALGLAAAFLRQRLDDTFRGRSEVERVAQAPVLAVIPRIKGRKSPAAHLAPQRDPHGGAAEAYRALRTGVIFASRQTGLRTLAITSPSEGEGKSITAANLATVLGQTGQRIALVSADMRRPTLERYFLSEDDFPTGLSSWLTGTETEMQELTPTGVDNVHILPCGPIPHNPAELLTSPRFTDLTSQLRQRYDFVIFDTPPVLPVADVATLAATLDGTLLVFDAASTHRSSAAAAREELARVGVNIVGTVLNGFDPQSSSYYYSSPHYAANNYRSAYASTGADATSKRVRKRRLLKRRTQ